MFIPSDSTGRFLTAPVRAIKSFKRYLHSAFYQEPVRKLPKPLKALGALGLLGPSGPLGLLGLSGLSRQLI